VNAERSCRLGVVSIRLLERAQDQFLLRPLEHGMVIERAVLWIIGRDEHLRQVVGVQPPSASSILLFFRPTALVNAPFS
jgi:hypothetical protein